MRFSDIRIRVASPLFFALVMTVALRCAADGPSAPPAAPVDTAFTVVWPFFSHDGAKVFFIGRLFGVKGMGFFEVDVAGGTARELMWDSLDKSEPVLSPDGKRICYRAGPRYRMECCGQLFMMDADGSGKALLTPWSGYLEGQTWSPDGRFILAHGPVEENAEVRNQVFKIASDGSGWTLLTHAGRGHAFARWDMDGSNIFFGGAHPTNELASVVSVMNADGTNPRPIDSTLRDGHYARPSPARRELALLWKSDAVSEVGAYVTDYDSSSFPAGEGSFRKIAGDFPFDSEWSPDGAFIAQAREGPPGSLTADLYLLRRDGWTLRRLTEFYRVSFWEWSRDSRYIVFSSYAQAERLAGTFIADVQTGTIRKLTIHR